MSRIDYWANVGRATNWVDDIENGNRGVYATDRYIKDKPCVIIVERGAVETLPEQTVRIEMTRIQPDVNVGPTSRESRANTILIGYKDHPTIPDTDIMRGDRFIFEDSRFEVRLVFPATVGRVEAWLEQIQ